MEAYQQAADWYQAEESTSAANQCLLKVAGFAASTSDYKRAIEIYEQVAMVSLENTLLKWYGRHGQVVRSAPPLGSVPARLLRLLGARPVALDSSARPE